MKPMQSKLFNWFAAATAVAALAGCSSGGAPTVVNPVTSAPPVVTYTGPASANSDVQYPPGYMRLRSSTRMFSSGRVAALWLTGALIGPSTIRR